MPVRARRQSITPRAMRTARLGRHAEQILEVRRVVQQHHVELVVQVLSYAEPSCTTAMPCRCNCAPGPMPEHRQLGRGVTLEQH